MYGAIGDHAKGALFASQFPVDSTGSWNTNVPCSLPWIVKITDITDNMTGSASHSNSIFSPGLASPYGPESAKHWLTNTTGLVGATGKMPPGWVSPGPSCTIKDSQGNIVAIFVEIDGIKRANVQKEDCINAYDTINGGSQYPNGASYCVSDFNVYDPSIVQNLSTSCTSPTDPTCYGRIYVEMDRDWFAAGYCGPGTACDNGSLISSGTSATYDIQGFVFWDPSWLNQSWHSFSGWELHPLTAWRIHQNTSTLSSTTTSTLPSSTDTSSSPPPTTTATGNTAPPGPPITSTTTAASSKSYPAGQSYQVETYLIVGAIGVTIVIIGAGLFVRRRL